MLLTRAQLFAQVSVAGVATLLLAAAAADATAQQAAAVVGFVTGSGSTDGFTIAGRLRLFSSGKASGQFTIIVHRDTLGGETMATAICEYTRFDGVVFDGELVRFHSVGKCRALTSTGGQQSFTSDNAFGIADHGDPGVDTDGVDVNLLSGTGLSVPGDVLADGNFIVSGP
jgi:hypothetical protein